MSYILDALKRAEIERERERGAVPTLASSAASQAPVPRNTLVMVLLVLVLLLTAAALYAWLRPGAPAQAAPVRETAHETARAAPLLVAPPPAIVQPSTAVAPLTAPTIAATAMPAAASMAAPSVPASPAPLAAVPALAELPAAVRQGLPVLNVNGAVNAPAAADRLLFVNGQVLHEGDSVAPDLRVETIGLHSAQLSWRGQRFHVDY